MCGFIHAARCRPLLAADEAKLTTASLPPMHTPTICTFNQSAIQCALSQISKMKPRRTPASLPPVHTPTICLIVQYHAMPEFYTELNSEVGAVCAGLDIQLDASPACPSHTGITTPTAHFNNLPACAIQCTLPEIYTELISETGAMCAVPAVRCGPR